jgi:hypothetical protein
VTPGRVYDLEEMTMTYREITGTRRYHWRAWENGATNFCGWMDGGAATPETLAAIIAGLPQADHEAIEVRQVLNVADERNVFAGELTLYPHVYRWEAD